MFSSPILVLSAVAVTSFDVTFGFPFTNSFLILSIRDIHDTVIFIRINTIGERGEPGPPGPPTGGVYNPDDAEFLIAGMKNFDTLFLKL